MLMCCLQDDVDSLGGQSNLEVRVAVCCGRLQGLALCHKQQTLT